MRKKKFIIPLVALSIFGLVACGGGAEDNSSVVSVDAKSVTINNKDELQAEWYVTEGARNMSLTLDPVTNILNAVNSGLIVSTSSNEAVATAQGTGIIPVAAGTATITVTYGGTVSDSVEITITEPTITAINTIASTGDSVRVRGEVTMVASTGIVVDDGTGGLYVYGGKGVDVGDYVEVMGTTAAYHGAYQLASGATITEMEGSVASPTIDNPTKLTADNVNTVIDSSDGSTNYHLKPVTFVGTAFMSGTYQAVQVEDAADSYLIEPTGWSGDWEVGTFYEFTGYVAAYWQSYSYSAFYISELKESSAAMTDFTLSTATGDNVAYAGIPLTINVNPTPVYATDKAVTWAVDDATKGSITDAGVFTAASGASGNVVITATGKTNTSLTKSITLEIKDMGAPVTGLTLDKTTVDGLHAGLTETLKATVTVGEGGLDTVTWTSSDDTIATVSDAGVVTGVKEGTATITVTTQNVDSTGKNLTATCEVKVIDIYNTLETAYSPDEFGDFMAAEGKDSSVTNYEDGTVYLTGIVESYSWSSSDSNATVYLYSSKGYTVELYKAVFADGVTRPEDLVGHTVTASGDACNYRGTYELNTGCQILSYSEATVAGYFSLASGSLSVKAGGTNTIAATYIDTTATTAFTVASADEKVATVSAGAVASGVSTITVTGVAIGETTITVTSGDFSRTFAVSVVDANTVQITTDTLGITGAYNDYTKTTDGVSYSSYQCADYGNGIQMRYSSSKASYVCNTTAFPRAIKSVTLNFNSTFTNTKDLLYVAFGSASVAAATEGIKATKVADSSTLTITPTDTTSTFFKLGHTTTSGATYVDSIVITLEAA